MTGCNKKHEFIVNENIGHIELRIKGKGEFVRSVACKKCLPQLKNAIKKLEKWKRDDSE